MKKHSSSESLTPLGEVLGLDLQIPVPGLEIVAAVDALGRECAVDYEAAEDMPRFDVSAVDGFAVSATDCSEPGAKLRLIGEIAAGGEALSIAAGEAVAIMTGAVVPPGADACVMVEESVAKAGYVSFSQPVAAGQFVRRSGSDVSAGDLIVAKGTRLTPGAIGSLASNGITQVQVIKKPRVALISTGAELVEPASTPSGSQIRDANRSTLTALLSECGIETLDLGIVQDDPKSLSAALDMALSEEVDAIVTSGGVSMGNYDFVKALAQGNETLASYKLAIKPAKPLVIGRYQGTPMFGLPGNPISCIVSFELVVRQYLLPDQPRAVIDLPLRSGFSKPDDGKTHYKAGHLVGGPDGMSVELVGETSSHQLNSYVEANCLVEFPEAREYSADEVVRCRPMGSLSRSLC